MSTPRRPVIYLKDNEDIGQDDFYVDIVENLLAELKGSQWDADLLSELTPEQLLQTFRSARLVRAITRAVAQKFEFASADPFEIDPAPIPPEITGKPVRPVLSRSAVSHKGWVFSIRAGEILPWEARTELNAVLRLDCMPGMTAIVTQPLTIEYVCPFSHRRRKATPDIYVEIDGRPLLIEVKKAESHLGLDEQKRFALLEWIFARAGVPYRVWFDAQIREEPYFSNAVWLARYKNVPLSDANRVAVLQFFSKRPHAQLAEVAGHLGDNDLQRSYGMVLRGWLIADPEADVRDNPRVQVNPRMQGVPS